MKRNNSTSYGTVWSIRSNNILQSTATDISYQGQYNNSRSIIMRRWQDGRQWQLQQRSTSPQWNMTSNDNKIKRQGHHIYHTNYTSDIHSCFWQQQQQQHLIANTWLLQSPPIGQYISWTTRQQNHRDGVNQVGAAIDDNDLSPAPTWASSANSLKIRCGSKEAMYIRMLHTMQFHLIQNYAWTPLTGKWTEDYFSPPTTINIKYGINHCSCISIMFCLTPFGQLPTLREQVPYRYYSTLRRHVAQ